MLYTEFLNGINKKESDWNYKEYKRIEEIYNNNNNMTKEEAYKLYTKEPINTKDLIKRIIDACNYNEMCIDLDLSIEYACMIAQDFISKDANAVSEDVILPLMQNFRDSEDKNEQNYIQETITKVIEFVATF